MLYLFNIGCVGLLALAGYIACLRVAFWKTLAVGVLCAALNFYVVWPNQESAMSIGGVAAAMIVGAVGVRLIWRPEPRQKRLPITTERQVVIDGTNVLYWQNDTADLGTLKAVVTTVLDRGFVPIVFLDASSRHHLRDKSLNERGFAKALGITKKQVMVCPANIEADVFILKYAKSQALPIISNDRFRDRAQQAKSLKLIKGVMVNGSPILDGLGR